MLDWHGSSSQHRYGPPVADHPFGKEDFLPFRVQLPKPSLQYIRLILAHQLATEGQRLAPGSDP